MSPLKGWLGAVGLLEPARRIRATLDTPMRRVQRRLGIVPHKASEGPAYWEARGASYIEEVASIYTDPADPYFQAQAELLAQLRAIPWRSLVEVGCGFGWHLRELAAAHPDRRLAGVDFSRSQLAQGRGYLHGLPVALIQGDVRRLPFRDGAFDVVLASGLLLCIHPDQLATVLQELARVTRQSIVILDYAREDMDSPTRRSKMDQAPWHGHAYTEAVRALGWDLATHFRCHAFAAHPDRVPVSFFHVITRCPST